MCLQRKMVGQCRSADIMFNHRKEFDMIVTLFYTLFSLTKATDPPSTFVGVRRFDPVAGDNTPTYYDEVK